MGVRYLKVRELADRWRMQPRTVSRWCRTGKIRAEKWGRVWRIPMDEVHRQEDKHAAK